MRANGIQAMDLVGRKLGKDGGRAVMAFFGQVGAFCQEHAGDDALKPYVAPLAQGASVWSQAGHRTTYCSATRSTPRGSARGGTEPSPPRAAPCVRCTRSSRATAGRGLADGGMHDGRSNSTDLTRDPCVVGLRTGRRGRRRGDDDRGPDA